LIFTDVEYIYIRSW